MRIYATAQSFHPKNGYVPNDTTAIKIAEAVWLPIYGNQIYSERPFAVAIIGDSVWHVAGTLPRSHILVGANGDTTYYMHLGGVAHVLINKLDGRILNVWHTK